MLDKFSLFIVLRPVMERINVNRLKNGHNSDYLLFKIIDINLLAIYHEQEYRQI